MFSPRNRISAIAGMLLMVLALAACGSTSGGSASTSAQQAAAPTAAGGSSAAAPATGAAKLNLNDVTSDQLTQTIPGFSNRMVREFQEYRPYASILEFRKEIGKYVDAATVANYEQYVFVPIQVDQADAATLQQLPGVDAKIADQLISGRPYGSNDAFLAKLGGLISKTDLAQASAYLAK